MPTFALVVDDSMLVRYTVSRFLEEHGYTVESATNGLEAVEVLNRMQPDLIVTDMQMPKMSGSELISAVKAKPEMVAVPIIIVAGRSSGIDPSENRADFIIYKDIDIEGQLGKALDALLRKADSSKAGGR